MLLKDIMAYKEAERCRGSIVSYRLCKLLERNGIHTFSGLGNIPVAPEIPQPKIEEEDDPATQTFGRGESESLESTHTIPEMPKYEKWTKNKTHYKPLLDAKGFDWNIYIIQMRIIEYMEDLSSDSDEEPLEEEKVNFKDY